MKPVPKPSGKSTAARATYASVTLIVFIAITLTILATACSSTSIEEPQPPNSANSDDLVITLSTPETYTFPSSRADGTDIHAGHELRYTAILYKSLGGSSPIGINGTANRVQRIEKLDKNGNQIVFKSIDPGSYFIVVFADYIDENAELSSGHYADKYYDTTSSPNYITLLAQNEEKLYFNNDNLDFFIDHTNVFKKEKNIPKEFKITLHRHVSMVKVTATGGSMEALKEIVMDKCFTLPQLDIISGTATAEGTKNMIKGIVRLDILPKQNPILLCYYYTFSTGSNKKALGETSFTLIPNEGYTFFDEGKFTIPSGKIVPEANTKYQVQGDFLSPSQVPSTTVNIKVTADNEWHDESQNVSN
ncbi:MAG: hypothetical protein K2H60_06160 [Muribaculaceae bacterium]|nr:hypothetical protein [Muribaculaceae bacterium]